jgi:hypothetical protein
MTHYSRWRINGDPLIVHCVIPPKEAVKQFFEKALSYCGEECLIWPYSRDRMGYATMHRGKEAPNNTCFVSRRICYAVHGAPPTPKHEAAHSCGKGGLGCIAPLHLRWATHRENVHDGFIHGTIGRGETHRGAKLTDAAVREIRLLAPVLTHKEIARRFGVAAATIDYVVCRRTWRHVL